MEDLERRNSILHYMSGVEPFSNIFTELIKSSKKWCPFHHGDGFNIDCYNTYPQILLMLEWVKKYLVCCKYLDANKYHIDSMNETLQNLLTPERLKNYSQFMSLIDELQFFISFIETDIQNKLTRLICIECDRLDEALVCYQNYCFYSAVVMAVSAVEYRIAEMIRRSDQTIYDEYFEGATLGHLIKVFDDGEYKDTKFEIIKKLMPDRHKPLVLLLNDYRVFAAHPKIEIITPQISEAVIHLAFSFLTDTQTCPYKPEELVHSYKPKTKYRKGNKI